MTLSPESNKVDFGLTTGVSPQSMTLASLFDTFAPEHGFGGCTDGEASGNPSADVWANDMLFGFMSDNGFNLQGVTAVDWNTY